MITDAILILRLSGSLLMVYGKVPHADSTRTLRCDGDIPVAIFALAQMLSESASVRMLLRTKRTYPHARSNSYLCIFPRPMLVVCLMLSTVACRVYTCCVGHVAVTAGKDWRELRMAEDD